MDGFDGFLPLQASRDAEAVRGADVVLFCVKSGDTDAAGREIAPFLADGCTVLSLQNGVDNAERLSSVLAGPPVLPAVVYVAAEMAGAAVSLRESLVTSSTMPMVKRSLGASLASSL